MLNFVLNNIKFRLFLNAQLVLDAGLTPVRVAYGFVGQDAFHAVHDAWGPLKPQEVDTLRPHFSYDQDTPYNLFLDDERVPKDVTWLTLPKGPWLIVRNFAQFQALILQRGLPRHVSFDHDLADMGPPERSGKTCANYLVEYCMEHNLPAPAFTVHSKNPEGAASITSYLNNYNDFRKESESQKASP